MSKIQERGYIRVAINREIPGFCFAEQEDDAIQGFEVDLAHCIAKRIFGGNLTEARSLVELVPVTLAERADYVQDTTVDIVLGNYADTPERRKYADFAGHYMYAPQSPLASVSSPSIKTVDDLNGVRIIGIRGTLDLETAVEIAPHASTVEVDTVAECLEAIGNGSAQVHMSNTVSNAAYVKQHGNLFRETPIRIGGERWAVGHRKGDDDFHIFIDDVVSDAFESGELNASLGRWLG